MNKLYFFFLPLLFIFSAHTFSQHHPKIDPYLSSVMQSEKSALIDVYAVFKERVSFDELQSRTSGLQIRKDKQREVVRILQEFADVKQAPLIDFLESKRSSGAVSYIAKIWAINTVAFKADASTIGIIASNFNEIEKIYFDPAHPFEELQDDEGITGYNERNNLYFNAGTETLQPGLSLINAPQVWAAGDSGQGVLVSNIDSGTDWRHPDLVNNIWNNLGEDANGNGRTIQWNGSVWVFDPGDLNGIDDDGNGLVDDLVGWNWGNNNNDVITGSSHGTATSGQVAGYGTNGTQTGVAPKAKLIILKPNSESQYWLAQQYSIAKGADIVTSSLSHKWYFNPKPNYNLFREMTNVELAAGVVHTNSTSNDGGSLTSAPIPFNIATPGNCPGPWIHPQQTLVGGLSSVISSANVLASNDLIVSSSPYGPAAWENYQTNNPTYPYLIPEAFRDYPFQTISGSIGLIKPDVAAPGNGTTSTAPGVTSGSVTTFGYQSFSGTSGATPHLAGVAALLLSANPALTPADVSRIMQLTSIDKGPAGKDNRYGAGRVDAWAAYQMAKAEVPVELSSFNANALNNKAVLAWLTVTETNNSGFYVERKKDNSGWASISFIPGAGTTTELKGYTYTDENLPSGNYVYRLKQVDFDGTFSYSHEIEVEISLPEIFILSQNYPNPFNPSTTIEFSLPVAADITINIYNALGEQVTQLLKENREAGYHKLNFDASYLPSGAYLYQIVANYQGGYFSNTKKMILLK
jgi:subtilisin family serine protease